jgi:hypothetical protein
LTDNAEKQKSILGSPLFWGTVATLFYVVGFFIFLGWIGNHPWNRLDLNEAGDFFAGAFAPLAFFWLVVAVLLQRSELQAQRKQLEQQMEELKLGRQELQLNREALLLQTEELKRQSDSLKQQFDVLMETKKTLEIHGRIVKPLFGSLR